MKKSTLISTLAMVVIVALALTTATFAWYTANSKVTATTTATAAVASSANLTIGADLTEAQKTGEAAKVTVALGNGANLDPAAPKVQFSSDTTYTTGTGETGAAGNLKTATVNELNVFTSDEALATVLVDDFFIYNHSEDTAVTPKITMTASSAEDAVHGESMLRVALFVITTADGTDTWTYVDTLANANNAPTVYGTITNGSAAPTATYQAKNTTNLDPIAGLDSVHLGIVAWYDGALLTVSNSEATCDVVLTIDKA